MESLEESGPVFLGNPGPRVGNPQFEMVGLLSQLELDGPAGLVVVDGVGGQILQDLIEEDGVGRCRTPRSTRAWCVSGPNAP